MSELKWSYDPILCSMSAESEFGTYHSQRTWCDVAKLYLNGELLGAYGGGSHNLALEAAEKDYEFRKVMKDEH